MAYKVKGEENNTVIQSFTGQVSTGEDQSDQSGSLEPESHCSKQGGNVKKVLALTFTGLLFCLSHSVFFLIFQQRALALR